MTEAPVEASYVRLLPVDTTQLRALGLGVIPSVIPKGSLAEEKRELQGTQLQAGQEISIDYLINHRSATVSYLVTGVHPPDSFVGQGTEVEIQGEKQKDEILGSTVTERMREHLRFLHEELCSIAAEGLPADPLRKQIEKLERRLLMETP